MFKENRSDLRKLIRFDILHLEVMIYSMILQGSAVKIKKASFIVLLAFD